MKTSWKLSKLRVRDIVALLVGLYVSNYLLTPILVGEARLEAYFRPHSSQTFDSIAWNESGVVPDGKLGKQSPSYGKRYEMVDDVLKTRISVGMDAGQLKAILGNPDGGIVDKKMLKTLGNQYGISNASPEKEILESPGSIAYWSYHLAYQWQYPARSIWFPRRFLNFDRWMLTVKIRNGKVSSLGVSS
jgi:hypothetical protein